MLLDSPLVCWLQPWYRISYIRVSIVLGDTSTSQYITIFRHWMTLMLPNLPTWQEVNSDTCYYGMGYFCQQGIMIPWSIHIITFTHVDNPFVLLILSTQLNNFWFLLILAREIPAGIYYYYFSLWYANYSHDVTYQTSRSLQLWEIPLHPNTYTNH